MATITPPASTNHITNTGRAAAPLAVAGAAGAATAVWLAARLAGTELLVSPPGQPAMVVGPVSVIVAALVAGVAGWASLVVLHRLTRRARTLWTGLALAVLVASFAPVLSVQAAANTRAFLALMHVAVAAVLVPGLRRTVPPRA